MDFYDSSSVERSPESSTYCKWSSSISVKNPTGDYISLSDSYFGMIIKSHIPASGNIKKTNIVFVPLSSEFGAFTEDKTVSIKVSYSTLTTKMERVNPIVDKMFNITIKPIKSIIKLCNTQIS
jgi:hypothetical protein